MEEAEQAEAPVMPARAEPHCRIRFSCPPSVIGVISGVISSFLTRFPKVRLKLVATDRAVDPIEKRIDLAMRVRANLTSDAALTMQSLERRPASWSPAPHSEPDKQQRAIGPLSGAYDA